MTKYGLGHINTLNRLNLLILRSCIGIYDEIILVKGNGKLFMSDLASAITRLEASLSTPIGSSFLIDEATRCCCRFAGFIAIA